MNLHFAKTTPFRHPNRAGFTLVEIMVVVVVIGLLAAMAVGGISKVKEKTNCTTMANDIKQFAAAFDAYANEMGKWPPDANDGVFPPEMEGRLKRGNWEKGMGDGGYWDWQLNAASPIAGFSASEDSLSAATWECVDKTLDDGDITTGLFRRVFANRLAYIVQDN